MKILAMTRRQPGATAERIQALQEQEATAVWAMMGDGFVREIYFDKNKPCVVLVLEDESVAAAAARLDALPMVVERQIEFDYTELGPYRQLENLFAR